MTKAWTTRHYWDVDRTLEEFRQATVAALAHCVSPRTLDRDDPLLLDLNVLEEEIPVHDTKRYRERPRFRSAR